MRQLSYRVGAIRIAAGVLPGDLYSRLCSRSSFRRDGRVIRGDRSGASGKLISRRIKARNATEGKIRLALGSPGFSR